MCLRAAVKLVARGETSKLGAGFDAAPNPLNSTKSAQGTDTLNLFA